jgi:lipopolysaccharide/colanic/teichoic acid biosynthesis glycosyltransferase
MSLVGPRPAIPYEVDMYEPWHMRRLYTWPGISGLWQVTKRNSCTFNDMVKMDLEYIENQSFWLDMSIMLMTPLAILQRKCK